MNEPGVDPRLLEVLQHASNLQLFQLNAVIERMLADPRRILQVRKDLHMGQTVRFMDWRDGRMRVGKIIAMKDTQLTVHEDGTRSSWAVPYTAVEPPAPGAARPAAPPEPPPPPRAGRRASPAAAAEQEADAPGNVEYETLDAVLEDFRAILTDRLQLRELSER